MVVVSGKSRFRSLRPAARTAVATALRTMYPGMNFRQYVCYLNLLCGAIRVPATQSFRWCVGAISTPTRYVGGVSLAVFLLRTSFAAAVAPSNRCFLVPCSHSYVRQLVSEDCCRHASCGCNLDTRDCSMPPSCRWLLRFVRSYPAPPGFRRGRCGAAQIPCHATCCSGRCTDRAGMGSPQAAPRHTQSRRCAGMASLRRIS